MTEEEESWRIEDRRRASLDYAMKITKDYGSLMSIGAIRSPLKDEAVVEVAKRIEKYLATGE